MKSRILSFILIFTAFGLLPPAALAQETGDAALLPDIDSQNIEIRGEFTTGFPGLQRQPILGFDPTMRIYQVPADRRPFMETGADVVASLPVSEFSRPAPPVYLLLGYSDVNHLFTRIGVGSYSSPRAQVWAAVPLNDQSYIGADVDYTASTEGHLQERPSSYRYLNADLEYGTRLNDEMEFHLYAGLQSDFNYAAKFNQNNSGEIARIEFGGIHTGAELSHYKNEITGWKLQGNVRNFTTTFKSNPFPGEIDEWVYNGSFAYRWALGHPAESITLQIGGRGGTYEPETLDTQQWSTLQGGLIYERLFNYNTKLYAEVDLFYTSDFAEESYYPGGKLSVSHWFGDRVKITGQLQGKPYLHSVEQSHEKNRFLGYNNDLRHTYAIDASGEAIVKYYRGSRLNFGVTYLNARNYSYFLPDSRQNNVGRPLFDHYSLNYGDATNIKLFAGITHQLLPEKFWVSTQIYLQNPMLSIDEPIPYKENWGLRASTSFRPIDRITVKGWANYLGNREPGLPDTELKNILRVGGQLDVTVINGIGAYFKVINLLDQKYQYWQGYQERPLQIYGGVTIKL